MSVEVIRKWGMPRSRSRVIDEGASLVCRVERTRWPVSAACTAYSAVSVSRISPTMMMSGSWRSTVRRAVAKVSVDLRAHRHLVEVLEHHLDRVLDGDDVHLGLREVLEDRVERGGLAAAGGAGDEDDARGPRDEVVELRHVVAAEKPSSSTPFNRMSGSKMRSTAFSPKAMGMVETRSSISLPALLALDAAVLRPPLLRDVAAGQELDARDHRLVDDLRDDVDVVQDPVDAQAHQGELALGLEVDVARRAARRRSSGCGRGP